MLALLPRAMIETNTDDMIMDFNVDLNSPLEVIIKSLNGKKYNEIEKFEQPFFLVSATVEKYQPKRLSFTGGLVIFDMPPKIDEDIQSSISEDRVPIKNRKFEDLVKNRWNLVKKKKDRAQFMNSKAIDIKIDSKSDYLINSAVQTNISGIITDECLQKWKLKASKKLCLSLIWSFLENCFVLKRHYNEETYDISQLIYLTSAKTYILMREFLPLPSFQKLYLKYGDELKNEKKIIEDLSMIEDIVMRYKFENHILLQDENESTNQIFAVTLAIDAFAFKSFSTTALTSYKNITSNQSDDKKVYNNGFLYMMIPIDFRYPSIILHIEKESAGNYNENIDKIAKIIKITLMCHGFNVWFKATDGDRYPSQEHINFFNNHIAGKSGDFLKMVNNLFNELVNDITLTIPIGDPFHLFKTLRSRYQIHPIKLYADSDLSTNYEKAESILKIGQALSDITHLGKMRDCYCIKFFTLENVVKLLKAGNFVDSAFIFPVAC